MQFSLYLTHDCNLACSYCYSGAKDRRRMSWETALRGLDLAFTFPGEVDLGYFGGESLLALDLLLRISREARAKAAREDRRLRLSCTTNGTLLTPARVQALREVGVELALSLDGTRAAHDATRRTRGHRSSFDRVLRGAHCILDAGLPLDVIAVVAPANVRWLGESVRFLAGLGPRQVVLNPCFEVPWSDEDLALWEAGMHEAAEAYAGSMRAGIGIAMPTFDNKLLAAAKGGLAACDQCAAGERELAVAPSGNLYPCARLVGEDRDHRLVVGHLDTGVDRRAVRRIQRGPKDPACATCAEKWRCGASCACANWAETGTTDTPGGTQCWYEQTSARIADAMGLQLIEEQCPTFLSWIYGRVAEAAERARARETEVARTGRVKRARRLPVVS